MSVCKKATSLMGAAALATAMFTTLAPASAAHAVCDQPSTLYSFKDKAYTTLPTDVMTPWMSYPGDITLSQTTTATAMASVTATVSAEAGIVFAKASASLGVTVGGSWSKSSTWSAHQAVPKGKQARLRLYHEALGFEVTKKVTSGQCGWKTVYTSKVIAPVETGSDVVKMNTRDVPAKGIDTAQGDGTLDNVPQLGGLPAGEQPTVLTIPETGDLTDIVVPNGLPDEPIID
ncbi:MAG: hypothetical protein ACJ786_27490 [Catenulispora sp.]